MTILTFDLTRDRLRKFQNLLKSTRRELSFAASPTSLWPSVLKLGRGGGGGWNPPPSGARSAKYPGGARVNPGAAGGGGKVAPLTFCFAIPQSGATLAHFKCFCFATHIVNNLTMIMYFVC